MNCPGEPEKCASAGTTEFGSSTVLSAIFAQSLMIQNFPYCAVSNQQFVMCKWGDCCSR